MENNWALKNYIPTVRFGRRTYIYIFNWLSFETFNVHHEDASEQRIVLFDDAFTFFFCHIFRQRKRCNLANKYNCSMFSIVI